MSALPPEPACWAWPLPPLPAENRLHVVRHWQNGRCAVCGEQRNLVEDHDHTTGATRGYLCEPCNVREGRANAHNVFRLYRGRYPTVIVGVLHQYGQRNRHPVDVAAKRRLHEALATARWLGDPDYRREREKEIAELGESDAHLGMRALDRYPTQWTPLARAVHRVGLTAKELADRQRARERFLLLPEVCLPIIGAPPTNLCDGYPWRPPPPSGGLRRPCAVCAHRDPDTMQRMIGPNGTGPSRDEEIEHLAKMWAPPVIPRTRVGDNAMAGAL